MKKLLIIMSIAFIGCNNQEGTHSKAEDAGHQHPSETTGLQLNSGKKWKADQSTLTNVAAFRQLINDSSYADAAKRMQLHASLQSQVDTLIKQCRMQGPDHDALHVWLEGVLKDVKELKDDDDDYEEVHAALKNHVDRFYSFFE